MTYRNALADALGTLKAQIAKLEAEESKIRAELIALGHDAIEGELFRATVSHSVRETLDMEAVRAKLTPQWISKHTNYTPVVTVRCVARTWRAA